MQHVTVIDYRAWAGREDELGKRDSEVTSQLGWGPEHKTFEWLASYRRMRDRRASFGSLAPLAIFPLDPEDIADLMLGHLELRTMLRGDLLEQASPRTTSAPTSRLAMTLTRSSCASRAVASPWRSRQSVTRGRIGRASYLGYPPLPGASAADEAAA